MSATPFSPIEIRLPKEVTFYEATALHKVWTGQLEEAGPAPLAIRDEALETCDTAGAQLHAATPPTGPASALPASSNPFNFHPNRKVSHE